MAAATARVGEPTDVSCFYRTLARRIIVVPVTLQPSFTAGPPTELFEKPVARLRAGTPGSTSFEVTGDRQRFLLNLAVGSEPSLEIGVVLNWRGAR